MCATRDEQQKMYAHTDDTLAQSVVTNNRREDEMDERTNREKKLSKK